MTYPYDGIRSMIEFYEDYIEHLKKQNEILQKQNHELEKLLLRYTQNDDELLTKMEKIKTLK